MTKRRPLILIDVDGVLNVITSSAKRKRLRYHEGYAHQWAELPDGKFRLLCNPASGSWLTRLAVETGGELAWGTTWEFYANAWVSPLVGLPLLRFAPVDGFPSKPDGVVPWTEGRPFVWFDDEASVAERAAHLAAGQPHLVVQTNPGEGLTEAHIKQAREWLLALGTEAASAVILADELSVTAALVDKDTPECGWCGSSIRTERGYVPGFRGGPVECTAGWHDDFDEAATAAGEDQQMDFTRDQLARALAGLDMTVEATPGYAFVSAVADEASAADRIIEYLPDPEPGKPYPSVADLAESLCQLGLEIWNGDGTTEACVTDPEKTATVILAAIREIGGVTAAGTGQP